MTAKKRDPQRAGRRSKYETDVLPRLDEVRQWAGDGVLDKDIAANLGISNTTICKYKNEHPEFAKAIKEGRKRSVAQIKRALFLSATGYDFTEMTETEEPDENGTMALVRRVRVTKHAHPNPASGMILLKQWARDEGWTNDPQQLALRKQELELKRQHMEEGEW